MGCDGQHCRGYYDENAHQGNAVVLSSLFFINQTFICRFVSSPSFLILSNSIILFCQAVDLFSRVSPCQVFILYVALYSFLSD